MRSLECKRDIQTSSQSWRSTGVIGEPLREINTGTITPEMHRAIYQRHQCLPKGDAELIEAVREVGIIKDSPDPKNPDRQDAPHCERRNQGRNQARKGQRTQEGQNGGKDNDPKKSKGKPATKQDKKPSNLPEKPGTPPPSPCRVSIRSQSADGKRPARIASDAATVATVLCTATAKERRRKPTVPRSAAITAWHAKTHYLHVLESASPRFLHSSIHAIHTCCIPDIYQS